MCVSKENTELLEGDLGEKKGECRATADAYPASKRPFSTDKRGEILSDLRHAET